MNTNLIKNPGVNFLLFCLVLLLSGCDLAVQEPFEFNPEIAPQQTFDMTALEWIRSNPNEEFNYLDSAITITGLEAEYSTNSGQRTYLLLKDRAFTDGGEILQQLGGSRTAIMADLDVDRLRTVLRYHIIDEYVSNGFDELAVLYTDYIFQSLVPGEAGRVSINRDDRFRLSINRSPDLSGTKKGARLGQHNYIFTNGVAHLSNDSFRNEPF